jgi:hypothetical protein
LTLLAHKRCSSSSFDPALWIARSGGEEAMPY